MRVTRILTLIATILAAISLASVYKNPAEIQYQHNVNLYLMVGMILSVFDPLPNLMAGMMAMYMLNQHWYLIRS